MHARGTTAVVLALALAALAPTALPDSHAPGNETGNGSADGGNATATDSGASRGNGTMETGNVSSRDAGPADGPDATNESTGGAVIPKGRVLLSDLGYGECDDGETVPVVVADGAGGGPSVRDYVETLCRPPAEAQAANLRLDLGGLVLLSLVALIVAGIFGAVWVRTSYAP